MSHEIYDNDSVVSYNGEQMWHGLGTVIDGYPTLEEAWKNSGMNWKVQQFPVQAEVIDPENEENNIIIELEDKFVNVRMDSKRPLGVVGADYEVIQNEDHWNGFVVPFAEHSQSKIETTGTLRNGKIIWFLLKKGTKEFIPGDSINEYFLLSSSHDGSLCTTIMSTPIRVVCNNTLTAAIGGTKNAYKIRHFKDHQIKVDEVKRALGMGDKFSQTFENVMAGLVNTQMNATQTRELLDDVIFPKPIANLDPSLIITLPKEREKVPVRTETMRQDKINKVMELVETGMGADIPGVRGTAYGLYNAVTEYFDHYGRLRKTKGDVRSEEEMRFESNMFGSSQKAKEESLNALLNAI